MDSTIQIIQFSN